jgi:hypothetical protein
LAWLEAESTIAQRSGSVAAQQRFGLYEFVFDTAATAQTFTVQSTA